MADGAGLRIFLMGSDRPPWGESPPYLITLPSHLDPASPRTFSDFKIHKINLSFTFNLPDHLGPASPLRLLSGLPHKVHSTFIFYHSSYTLPPNLSVHLLYLIPPPYLHYKLHILELELGFGLCIDKGPVKHYMDKTVFYCAIYG